MKQLKNLSKNYADELADIGITVQNIGKLKVNDSALKSTGRYQVSKLFAPDAEYGKQVEKQMKNTNSMVLRNNLNIPKSSTSVSSVSSAGTEPPQSGDGDDTAQGGNPPAAEDLKLAQQLAQALAGSMVDYSV